MNREIKFRYFDPENKVMVTEDMPLPNPTWILHNRMEEPYGSYILMQYTGLKDKNGKEIYEGDIVKGTTFRYGYELLLNGEQFDYMGQVIWLDGETIGYHVMDKNEAFWDMKDCVHRNNVDFITGEIIGNIYENPELLK